ncbi:MAG TPA: DUF4160 domain-containing protein [Flavisolibacter sp.]|nr:DUF4160 domain-containing protein [Flavisolibacter sp.]
MPRISSFFGISIWIYWDDHNPPHFHAKYNDEEILIVINDLTIYAGSLPSRAYGLVMEWASQHQQELKANWELAAEGLQPNKIEPLK